MYKFFANNKPKNYLTIIFFLFFGISNTYPANISSEELAQLEAQAAKDGAVPIMVTIEILPLSKIATSAKSISDTLAIKADFLYTELGENIYKNGRWSNGIGQIGFYANQAAIKILANSGSALSFQMDHTAKGRSKAFSLDGSLDAIDDILSKEEAATVDIVLNTDGPSYELMRDGATRYFGPSNAAIVKNLLEADFQKNGLRLLEQPASLVSQPIIRAQINREAFYGLARSELVRAIRPKDFIDRRVKKWPPEALAFAEKFGHAEITISLRGGSSYSTQGAHMPENSRRYQAEANRRALQDILANAGFPEKIPMSEADAFQGTVMARASPASLQKLFQIKDERILSVDMNEPAVPTALMNSTSLLNMPSAWLNGYLGSGQTIVVLDTGIRKSHEFFKISGSSKVTLEGCYGTKGYNTADELNYTSPCPSADDFGDSTFGLLNSGEPYSNVPFCVNRPELCRHGTTVAGAAAGHASPAIFPNALQGVAPTSTLTSISISSYNNANFKQVNFPNDMYKALTADAYGAIGSASNPYTVNMSIASDSPPFYQSNCPSVHTPMTTRIDVLKGMGIPVVIATGNRGMRWGIGWPSCIPNSIKVASVSNDSTGTEISTFSNIAPQSGYTGQIFFAPGGNGGTSSPNNVTSSYITSDTAVGPSQGTSIAAPQISGIYATIKSVTPGISVDDATAYIVGSAITITVPLASSVESFKRARMP
ncbi:S8 family serine peptidase [Acidovorax sacchari]|uniref:S8 family serine peptidase n=1 Tax=Acidovorax sacchari TaxID=3230736 RepID=UPI0039E6EBE1